MKRLFAFTLALCMVLISLAACGETKPAVTTPAVTDGTTAPVTDAQTTEPAVSTEPAEQCGVPDELDYNGYEFTILTAGNVAYDDFSFEEDTGIVLDNAQYQRKAVVEADLNVSGLLERQVASSFGNGPGYQKISNAVSSNDTVYDLGLIGTYDCTQLAITKNLYDLRSIKYVDLERSWWDQDANNDLNIKGLMFFTTGDITVSNNNQTFTIVFNKKIAEEEKIEDPYALVKEGKWTYAKLREMVKTVSEDINGDDIMDMRDKYGMIVWDDSVMAAVNSVGVRCCSMDENGQVTLTLNNETTTNVLNEWFAMTYDKNTAIYNQRYSSTNATHGNATKMWQEDRALFRNFLIDNVHALREVESDFGILPYPKLTEEQSRYYSTLAPYNGQFICVPVIQEDIERVGAITEALAYHGQQIVRPAFYEKTLFGGVIRDEESADMLDIMFSNYIYDFGWYFQVGEYNNMLIKMVRAYAEDFSSRYTAAERAAGIKLKQINKSFTSLAEKRNK